MNKTEVWRVYKMLEAMRNLEAKYPEDDTIAEARAALYAVLENHSAK